MGTEEKTWGEVAVPRLERLAGALAANSALLAALGDDSRQCILVELLRDSRGLRVGEVAARVGLSEPTVSHHLRVMREAGVVSRYRSGTRTFYHPSPDARVWATVEAMAREARTLVGDMRAFGEAGGEPCRRRTE